MSELRDLENLLNKAKAGSAPPVILIHGDQDYLVKQAYDRLLEALVPEDLRAFNMEQLDGSKAGALDVLDAWSIVPMMAGPKVVGVPEARYFQSKKNGAEILTRAKESWENGEHAASTRHLARALSLLETNWEDAQGRSPEDIAAALDASSEHVGGAWFSQALSAGLGAGVAIPSSVDESGILADGIEQALSVGVSSCLVFSTLAADGRKRIYKMIQERGAVLHFSKEAKGPQASQTAAVLLRGLLKQQNVGMNPRAMQRLLGSAGHDLGLMSQELAKMVSYAHPRTEIQEADLDAVCEAQPEESIFKLLDILAERDKGLPKLLPLLKSILAQHELGMVFNTLAKELRRLLQCRAMMDEGLVAARLVDFPSYRAQTHPKLIKDLPAGLATEWKKLNAYPAFKAFERCRKFSEKELRAWLARLTDMNLGLRGSGGDMERSLLELCLLICGAREEELV